MDIDVNKLHSIDDQVYYIDVVIYNQLEDQEPFSVPFFLIDSISIEESLTSFNDRGSISFNIDHDILEKRMPSSSKSPFVFRTDGRNKIRIQIFPVFNSSNDGFDLTQNSISETDELRKKWEINIDGVVYDVEDIDVVNVKNKIRKFYFYDERYQIFTEKNIEWSSGLDGRKTEGLQPATIGSLDLDRCCTANYALKSIIEKAGINPDGTSVRIGGKTLDAPTGFITTSLFSDEWYSGSFEENKIFYTSPAYSKVLDDINYILPFCGSKTDGPVFLNLTRWENHGNKNFELYTLKDYFKKAADEQVEHLIVNDGIFDPNTSLPYITKAPNFDSSETKNFTSRRASMIESYQFSQMVAADDSRLCNTPYHSFDFSTGSFSVKFTDNKIEDVKDEMTNIGKSGLYSFQTNADAHLLMNINRTKKESVMIKNHFSPVQFGPKFLPKNDMMRDLLFLNQSISFVVDGLTIRSPGRFLFIDKFTSNGVPDPFDDRFLGQWMVLKVVHFFKQGLYKTEIVASKIDTFRKIWTVDDKNY